MRGLWIFITAWAGISALHAATPDSTHAVRAQTPPKAAAGHAWLNPPAHSQWGYVLLDVRSGRTLAEKGSRRLLTPASVAKLAVTGFALDRFGAARRWPTYLYRTGRLEDGVLHGDLWIRGTGNPALGSERGDSSQRIDSVFGLFAAALEKAGIRAVQGQVRGDASALPETGPDPGDLWEDVGNYYGAAPSGLCFHDNTYTLKLDGSAEKDHALAEVGVYPEHIGVSHFQIRAQTSAPYSPDSCNILGAFWNTPRLVVGTCPAGRQPLEIKGSLPDPAWTCARDFEDFLRLHHIAVTGPGPDGGRGPDPLAETLVLPADTVLLATQFSPSLLDLLAILHGYSDNLYAAQLLALAGGGATRAENLRALNGWLDRMAPGITRELRLTDGNGLSRRDAVTPAALAQLLRAYARQPWFPDWRETLLGGKLCALRPAEYADGLNGRLWSKTGSMGGVASLAGYLQTRSGRLLAFAILVNHFDESPASVRARWGGLLRAWSERR